MDESLHIPAVVLLFVGNFQEGIENQYSVFDTIDKAAEDVRRYFRGGGEADKLIAYVDPDHGDPYAYRLQGVARELSGKIISCYGISYAVLYNAL